MNGMNILVTLNAGYLPQLEVMLFSLLRQQRGRPVTVYVANSSLTQEQLDQVSRKLACPHCTLVDTKAPAHLFEGAPITSRYPKEMYYRIFAGQLLPRQVERILYLDPDLVVINPLDELWELEMGENLFAAATHIQEPLRTFNEFRLGSKTSGPYINSGVMLMNLPQMRRHVKEEEVFAYIDKYKNLLMLPDQDVISALYGEKIVDIDAYRYNLSERMYTLSRIKGEEEGRLTLDWVRENAAIIHYCGRNKPWKENYMGSLNRFYHECKGALDSWGQQWEPLVG